MNFMTYTKRDSSVGVINLDDALDDLRELGHGFAIALAERGHKTEESDLMSGLAAYHLLKLEGEDPRLDAAHKLVVRHISSAMFDHARSTLEP